MCDLLNKSGWGHLASTVASISLLLLTAPLGQAENVSLPSPSPGGSTSLQIVNATGVPKISLSLNGRMIYTELNQAAWTGSASWPDLTARFSVVNLANGAKANSESIKFQPGAYQTLVIMGDFSTDVPPGRLPQPGAAFVQSDTPYPPNVLFRVYSHAMGPQEKKLRFRFVNGMPGVSLEIRSPSVAPTQIAPGEDLVLSGQPKPAVYEVTIKGRKMMIPLVQKEDRNQTVVFYLKDGMPKYLAITEERE